jgi:serine protease Do
MNRTLVNKLVHVLAAMLLGAAVVLTGAPTASSDKGSNTADLEKSVVYLQTKWTGFVQVPPNADAKGQGYWTDRVSYSTSCTAWYVSKTAELVTAGHCVDPQQGREVILNGYLGDQKATNLTADALANWHVEGDEQGAPVGRSVQAIQPQGVDGATITSPTTVEVVDFKATDAGDVALLHLPNMAKETPGLIVAQNAPKVGDPVTSIGFPGELQDVADQSQIARASFKSGSVSSQQVTPQGVTQIEVSAPIGAGMSGGPTVDQDGQVVGVNSAGLADQANFNFITDTPDLRTFLLSHNVVLIQPPAAPESGSGALWYIIGGVVLVLVVAGALLLLVLRRRKPQLAAAGNGSFSAYPAQGPAPYPMQNPLPVPPQAASFGGPTTGMAGTAPPTLQPHDPQATTAPTDSADAAVRTNAAPGPVSGGTTQPASGDTLASETTPTTGSNFCPSCGAAHRHDDHFCPGCGKPVT